MKKLSFFLLFKLIIIMVTVIEKADMLPLKIIISDNWIEFVLI